MPKKCLLCDRNSPDNTADSDAAADSDTAADSDDAAAIASVCRRRIIRVCTRLSLTVFNFDTTVRVGRRKRMFAAAVTEWFASTSDTPG